MTDEPEPTLVDTPTAAHAAGVAASGFQTWARRRGLEPVDKVRRGRRFMLRWSLDDVFAATRAVDASPEVLDKLRTGMSE